MKNLEAVLSSVGATLRDVVQVRAYLAELDRDFREFDDAYALWWREYKPARTTVGVALYGISVEMDAIAVLPPAARKPQACPPAERAET